MSPFDPKDPTSPPSDPRDPRKAVGRDEEAVASTGPRGEASLDEELASAAWRAFGLSEGGDEAADDLPRSGRPTASSDSLQARTLERLYLETLGLVPYALEPVEPSPGARERLLASLPIQEGEGATLASSAGTSPRAEASGDGRRPSRVVPFTPPAAPAGRPTASGGSAQAGPVSRSAAKTGPGGRRLGSTLAWMAAAVVILGLLGLSGWLATSLSDTQGELRRAMAEVDALLERLDDREESWSIERARLADELDRLGGAVTVMSSRGVEICPLRPAGIDPAQPEAFAVLFMAPDRNQWYLSASNLEPAEEGRVYRVWLMTAQGPVQGGVLASDENGKDEVVVNATILGEEMLQGVAVTLEPVEAADGGLSPTGPMVLYGDEKMMVL